MYNIKVIILKIEMHLKGVRNTTYLATTVKVGEDLLRSEQLGSYRLA
jgi:hypothetical protein